MRRVVIESVYAPGLRVNIRYAWECIRDCIRRNEAPFASHLLYTGALRDERPDERRAGIEAGLVWAQAGAATIVYYDLGVSRGMAEGIEHAERAGRIVEWRTLQGWESYQEKATWFRLPPGR